MKKIILILFVLILVGCGKETELEFRFTDYYEYLIDNYDSIIKVEMISLTEAGRNCYDVTEFKEQLYNNVTNTMILSKSNIVVTDDDLFYKFLFADGTEVKYSYNGGYFHYNDQNYKIDNYYKLTDVEDYEIECN